MNSDNFNKSKFKKDDSDDENDEDELNNYIEE